MPVKRSVSGHMSLMTCAEAQCCTPQLSACELTVAWKRLKDHDENTGLLVTILDDEASKRVTESLYEGQREQRGWIPQCAVWKVEEEKTEEGSRYNYGNYK